MRSKKSLYQLDGLRQLILVLLMQVQGIQPQGVHLVQQGKITSQLC
jgi:hypothetical protein